MLSGENHCIPIASAGIVGRMYALIWVPLPPTIIVSHDSAITKVQGTNLHDP